MVAKFELVTARRWMKTWEREAPDGRWQETMDIQQGKYGRLPLDSNCPFQLEVPLPAPFDQILHAPDSVMDPKVLEG